MLLFMKKQLYQIIGIFVISILWVLLIPLSKKITIDDSTKEKTNITDQAKPNNTLTGNYDFVSKLWQLAFNYDTGNFVITESQPQEGSMILLTLSNKWWQKIGRIGVFHNGG